MTASSTPRGIPALPPIDQTATLAFELLGDEFLLACGLDGTPVLEQRSAGALARSTYEAHEPVRVGRRSFASAADLVNAASRNQRLNTRQILLIVRFMLGHPGALQRAA